MHIGDSHAKLQCPLHLKDGLIAQLHDSHLGRQGVENLVTHNSSFFKKIVSKYKEKMDPEEGSSSIPLSITFHCQPPHDTHDLSYTFSSQYFCSKQNSLSPFCDSPSLFSLSFSVACLRLNALTVTEWL